MQKLNQKELSQMIELHQLWLENDKDGVQLDISGKNCSGLFFNTIGVVKLDLSHSKCKGTNFYGANFENIDFSRSNFSYSNFDKVFFDKVIMKYVDFSFAYIDRVDFSLTDMSEVNFYEANIPNNELRNLLIPQKIKRLINDNEVVKKWRESNNISLYY